jgi:ubiquitin C-terminal hydrolase
MSKIKDSQIEISPIGFKNIGHTCYFNSLMQALLSCPSFLDNITHVKTPNTIVGLFKDLIDTSIKYTNSTNNSKTAINPNIEKLNNFSTLIWKELIISMSKKNKSNIRSFLQDMQCIGEGFNQLLDSLSEYQHIQNLFLHRYKTLIKCFTCDEWTTKKECMYNLFEVDPLFKTQQLEKFKKFHVDTDNLKDYLLKQMGHTDVNFECSKCKIKKERFRMDVLVMSPKILVVMSKKFEVEKKINVYTDFPEKIVFRGFNENMIYEAVAQIEHSGDREYGHYWTICKRNNKWFNLNDMSVSPAKFQPTNDTFIVMYHLK